MNKLSLVKYAHDSESGLLHYVIFEGDVVVLSLAKSLKVNYINSNGTLDVSFDIESNKLNPVRIEVVKDIDYVKKVYNYALEIDNAYFKDGYENLFALKFTK
ncbi:MAG: hypothetical protein QM489_03820 [Candidatus Izemoplasma sp.]